MMHKVFFYGTLKKGEPNHDWFMKISSNFGIPKIIGTVKTCEKYPLIIASKFNIPFLLDSPGNGTQVEGEVYEVNDEIFAKLDVLEDHPNYYMREERQVKLLETNEELTVWIYLMKNFKPELLQRETFESYTNGANGLFYDDQYVKDATLDCSSEIKKRNF